MAGPGNPDWRGVGGNPSGRPAGALGRVPAAAKDIILNSMSLVGGAERLAAWALESPRTR